jgi:DNA-binding helix-hairpin-helix protein with protein kinase domain
MAKRDYLDHLGRHVTLGTQLGQGGEGTVFEVVGCPDLVAKIYDRPQRPPSPQQETKLRAMVALTDKKLEEVAAWPRAVLRGPYLGFLMRKIPKLQDIHVLYIPSSRAIEFPEADWRFLVHAAMNCASAFDTLHSNGIVVGDVNQRNIAVSKRGEITLLDCDSYKITLSGCRYPCSEVGAEDYTPPELQPAFFKNVDRTANHDRFGLAVLLFYMLFLKHPFAGRYLGAGPDPSLGQKIREFRFAYGRSARAYQMQPPPGALPLSAVSTALIDLFERAFSPASRQPNARPAASEWRMALKAFLGTLRPCPSDPGHYFAPHLASCPWHGLMLQGAPNLFATVGIFRSATSRGGLSFSLDKVWDGIERVPPPSNHYLRPTVSQPVSPAPWPVHLGRQLPQKPPVPAILSAQLTPPPSLFAGLSPPSKPVMPTILTSPPAPPAFLVPRERQRRPSVPRSPVHMLVLIGTGTCAAGFIPVAICGALSGVAIFGSPGIWGGLAGVFVLFAFMALGVCCLILERMRRAEERASNVRQEQELDALRAEAKEAREKWSERQLAEQLEAKRRFEAELAKWEHLATAQRAEADRRQREWVAKAVSEQRAAKEHYEEMLRRWILPVGQIQEEVARRRGALTQAVKGLEAAEESLILRVDRKIAEFEARIGSLRAARQRHVQLLGELARERQQMEVSARQIQFRVFLQGKLICDYSRDIGKIGPGRCATLSSFGVETAFDVEEARILQGVPGFGLKLAGRLLSWRRRLEAQFVYEPAVGIPPHEIHALELKHAQVRQPVETALLSGEGDLKRIAESAQEEYRRGIVPVVTCLEKLAQAQADVGAIPAGL